MIKYIFKRILVALSVIVVLTTVTFFLMKLAPGDPVRFIVRSEIAVISDDVIDETRRNLNLDENLLMQWWLWFKEVLQFNFGESYQSGRPVIQDILFYTPPTMTLTIFTLITVVVISIPLGVLSAYYHNSLFDRMIQIFTSLTISVPSFFVGLLLIFIFNKWLGILPSSGYYSPKYVILPVAALTIGSLAYYVRLVRTNMLEALNGKVRESYQLRGFNESNIVFNDLLLPSLIPMITMLGMSISGFVGGAVVIEYLFNIPGIGTLLIESIRSRDYPLIQGIVIFLGVLVVLGNLAADIIVGILSPKTREMRD